MSKTALELELLLKKYEENGAAKLYYALNRKMWEMADTLNGTDLKTLSLDDPKDKTFDRLKIIWKDSADLSMAVKALGDLAGVTGNENKDIQRVVPISPQKIAKEGL
jgi:hypothetical protein